MAEHPVPERPVSLKTFNELQQHEIGEHGQPARGAAPGSADVTTARSHIRAQSVEDLEAMRDRLGDELVSRFEDHYGSRPPPGR